MGARNQQILAQTANQTELCGVVQPHLHHSRELLPTLSEITPVPTKDAVTLFHLLMTSFNVF